MTTTVSPLAPEQFPDMPPVAGVRLATAAAGIRYAGRTDVLLALFDPGTAVAGVFTRSKCPSAPVDWCRAQLKQGTARALVVNSGNANAFTGKSGREATKLTAKVAAAAAGCKPSEIFLASTGVIGEPLDATKFGGVMDQLIATAAPGAWDAAARAIMTTDTFPKGAAAMATSACSHPPPAPLTPGWRPRPAPRRTGRRRRLPWRRRTGRARCPRGPGQASAPCTWP